MHHKTPLKVLIAGGDGQLGLCLKKSQNIHKGLLPIFFKRDEFDLTDKRKLLKKVESEKPDFIVNCAAFTNVDGAEEDRLTAANVNHIGVANLAGVCAGRRIRIIHISTDFVFDGEHSKPYKPSDDSSPLNAYGETKLLGEIALREIMPNDSMIIRTSWLYSEFGSNFVKTMLALFDSKKSFKVVRNQLGSPTYAVGLAEFIWHILEQENFLAGVYHWCDGGVTNWFEFARQIGKNAFQKGLIDNIAMVIPIHSSEYETLAKRPLYSALDCVVTQQHYPRFVQEKWEVQLNRMLDQLVAQNILHSQN